MPNPFTIDTEVSTPRGVGTIVAIDGNIYKVNLHAYPGLGPFRYTARQLELIPVVRCDAMFQDVQCQLPEGHDGFHEGREDGSTSNDLLWRDATA